MDRQAQNDTNHSSDSVNALGKYSDCRNFSSPLRGVAFTHYLISCSRCPSEIPTVARIILRRIANIDQ